MPAELRPLFWAKRRVTYDQLMKTAWQTVDSFARRDPKLKGKTGAHAVLHTHNHLLGYHPHMHLIVPAGAVNQQDKEWRTKDETCLFPQQNLARVIRAKWLDGMRRLGLEVRATLPDEWVVDCKAVGYGKEALTTHGRYFYRGVLPEKNILSDSDGLVSFRIKEQQGTEVIQTLPGWRISLVTVPTCAAPPFPTGEGLRAAEGGALSTRHAKAQTRGALPPLHPLPDEVELESATRMVFSMK